MNKSIESFLSSYHKLGIQIWMERGNRKGKERTIRMNTLWNLCNILSLRSVGIMIWVAKNYEFWEVEEIREKRIKSEKFEWKAIKNDLTTRKYPMEIENFSLNFDVWQEIKTKNGKGRGRDQRSIGSVSMVLWWDRRSERGWDRDWRRRRRSWRGRMRGGGGRCNWMGID